MHRSAVIAGACRAPLPQVGGISVSRFVNCDDTFRANSPGITSRFWAAEPCFSTSGAATGCTELPCHLAMRTRISRRTVRWRRHRECDRSCVFWRATTRMGAPAYYRVRDEIFNPERRTRREFHGVNLSGPSRGDVHLPESHGLQRPVPVEFAGDFNVPVGPLCGAADLRRADASAPPQPC